MSDYVISAKLSLPDDEEVAELEVFSALRELLTQHGLGDCQIEVWREGGNGAVLTNGRGM